MKKLMIVATLAMACLLFASTHQGSTDAKTAVPPAFAMPTRGFLGACWNDPGVTSEGGTNHTGLDLWSAAGDPSGGTSWQPVFAVSEGTVSFVDDRRIEITLDTLSSAYDGIVPQRSGLTAYYTHLSQILVNKRDPVSRGELIGYQGKTGTDIVHLHWSLKKGTGSETVISNTLDPSPYLGANYAYPSCGLGTSRWMEPFRSSSNNVDVALIIDSSGSMEWNDPKDMRKEAAVRFINAALPGDDVAIVDFDDFARTPGPIGAIPGGRQDLISAVGSIDSVGGTDIGSGVREACAQLASSPSANPKAAVLLTDGQNNFTYGNDHDCFKDKGWPIYTIGLSPTADEALL